MTAYTRLEIKETTKEPERKGCKFTFDPLVLGFSAGFLVAIILVSLVVIVLNVDLNINRLTQKNSL